MGDTNKGLSVLKNLIIFILIGSLSACASTSSSKQRLSEESFAMTSNDSSYGFNQDNPIHLGGFLRGTKYEGAHYDYFDGLLGPHGERVMVERVGSCCGFEDSSMPFGGGMLDRYRLSYEGIKKPVIVYVNLYKFEKPMAPQGFALL